MEKLQIFRCGIWIEGTYLNEIKIKTEEYSDFDYTFSQLRYYFEKEYEIEDHCNNPFCEVEQFLYWFDDKDGIKVYVQRSPKEENGQWVRDDNNKLICDGIEIGIKVKSPKCKTAYDLIYLISKYVKLYEKVVDLFKKEYEVNE